MQQSRDDDLLKGPQIDQDMELSRLRKEHRILREERETLKIGGLLREPKIKRFSLI
jgi:hypothetical protein